MAFIPTGGLSYAKGREGRSQAPYVQAGVQIGRVIAVYRQNHTVDLAMGTGELWRRVHVAGTDMGTRTGEAYLPTPSNQVDEVAPDGPVGNFNDDGNRSMYAVVGFVNEDPNHPLVLGFLNPRTNQMLFDRPGFNIKRHESDLYTMIENGLSSTYDAATDTTISNYEWVHPSGFFMRVGTGTTHENLTGQDVQKRAKFRGTANANTAIGTTGPNTADFTPITVKHPSGSAVQMDTSGNITLTPGPSGQVVVSGKLTATGVAVRQVVTCKQTGDFTMTATSSLGTTYNPSFSTSPGITTLVSNSRVRVRWTTTVQCTAAGDNTVIFNVVLDGVLHHIGAAYTVTNQPSLFSGVYVSNALSAGSHTVALSYQLSNSNTVVVQPSSLDYLYNPILEIEEIV